MFSNACHGATIVGGMHRKRAHFAAVLCLLQVELHAAPHNSVVKNVDTILSAPDLVRRFWGIEVVALDNCKTIYARNADKLFTPASNTKLFTTAAALL
jgi:D-alanyl-D-alanine carboxypeptidase/D-alanyl-D-alanine-endopeptidase (penicillin-binding protein 4)